MEISTSRENILEVARNVFSRFGFTKTTMSDIADESRKGRRTIYSYFKSKEEIYLAVIQKEVDILKNSLSGVVSEPIKPKEKLKKYFTIRMRSINELANYYEAIKNTYRQNFSMIEGIRQSFDKKEIIMISNILNEGNKRNEFDIKDSELTAKTMNLALKGLEVPIYFGNKKINIKNTLESIMDILFNGILKKN